MIEQPWNRLAVMRDGQVVEVFISEKEAEGAAQDIRDQLSSVGDEARLAVAPVVIERR